MKHKYLLVRDPNEFKPDSVVFCLWVGSSTREQSILALVQEVAKDCGWYFSKWNSEADFWLIQNASLFYPLSVFPVTRLLRADMNITDFYHEFERRNLDVIEKRVIYPKAFLHHLAVTDPNAAFQISHKAKPSLALSVKRKNLKSESAHEWEKAIISFWLILVIMGIDALVSWLFNI